jgi:Concanavalin A-like lectin/glucanases superfamily
MQRGWFVAVAVAGCGFRSSPATERPSDAGETADAPAMDAPSDGRATALCDDADGDVVACYDFDGQVLDGSSSGFGTTSKNVSFDRGVIGMAVKLDTASRIDVGDTDTFDLDQLTIEAWIQLTALPPAGQRFDLLDVNGQYALSVQSDGVLLCQLIGGAGISSMGQPVKIAAQRWTHVACTYDRIRSALYIDGAQVAMRPDTYALARNGDSGMSIGGDNPSDTGNNRLIGLIDEFRLLKVARTGPEICRDAGKTVCL